MLRRDPGQSISFRDSSNRGSLFHAGGPIILTALLTMMLVGAPQLVFGQQNPAITVNPTSLTIAEEDADNTGTFTVQLATEPTGDVRVRISPGRSGDVSVDDTSLEFTSGNYNNAQTVTVTVAPDDDAITDDPVTLKLTASGADYGGVTRDLTVNITEDDERGVTVAPTELTVEEGDSEKYEINLDSEPSGPVTVRVEGATGDVRVSPPSLTFTTGNWDTKKEFTVSVVHDADAVDDPDVTLTHTVSGGDYDTGVTADDVTVTIMDDDTQALTVTPTELAIREGSSRDYRVRLETQPTGEVTVTVGGLSSDVDVDVDNATLTFTTGNWNRNQTVKVSVGEDDDALDDPDVTLTNTASGADYDTGVDAVNVTVKITDNDTPAIRVSPTSLTIPEQSDDRFYTVELTTEPTNEVEITVAGFSGTDVSVDPSTLTFTAADWTAKRVTLEAADDADAMTDDTVTLTHTVSTTATEYQDLEAADVRVNITENDRQFVKVDPTSLTITEGATGTYAVELGTEPTGDVTITVGGVSGDVSVDETTLTFTPQNWNSGQTVTVTAGEDDDAVTDPVVTLTHTVRGADYQDRGVTAPAVAVTIAENDKGDRGVTVSETSLTIPEGSTRTYTVVLGTEPSADVTVTVGGSTGDVSVDRSTRTLRFTDKNWDQDQTVEVHAAKDDDAVVDDAVTLTHTVRGGDYSDETANDVEVTITENEVTGVVANPSELEIVVGKSTSYKLSLTSRPTERVTVTVSGAPQDESVTVSPDEFTLSPSSWKSGRTVTVRAKTDAGTTTVELIHTVNGGDYDNEEGGEVTVEVKDSGSVGVAVNPTVLSVNEGSRETYTIVLTSEPTDTVTVAVGVAPEDSGVTVSPDEFTFTTSNWNRSRSISVRAAQDDNTGNEEVTLSHTLTSVDGSYDGASSSDVTVTVMDNDRPGVSISPTSLRIAEGSSKTYTVELQTQPSADVTVSLTVGDGDVTVSGSTLDTTDGKTGSLTFNQDNWNAEQTVTVEAVDDTDSDDDEVTISHAVTGAIEYAEVIAPSVMVTATDDDQPAVKVSTTSLVIPEGQSRDYTVVLATVPTETVTVTLGDASGDDVDVDPKTLVFSVGNWNQEQTVTVTANEDEDAADDDDVTISHSVSGGNYDRVRAPSVTVTIEENDLPSVTVNPTSLEIDEGESDTYRVALTTQPTQSVTVTIDGAADDVTVDPPTLTFNSENWEQGEEVTVSVAEDGDALQDPAVTLTHTVRGGEYDGVVPDDVVVTIGETGTRSVEIDPTYLEIPEGGDKTYTVVLTSQPTATVTVTVTISGASGDVSVNKRDLRFTSSNWHQEQTVMVSAAEDEDAESDDAVTLDHRVRGGDYTPVVAPSVTVAIAENDSRGVKVTPTALEVPEDGDRTYRVELTSQPSDEVTVVVQGATGSITVSPSTWKFTTSNWDRPQTVTVSAAEDTEDPPENESVELMNTVSGGGYDDVPAASVAVTAIDNDAPGVAVSPTALEIDEGSSATYQIVLTEEPSGTVTIDVGGEDEDVSVSPDRILFSTNNYDRPRTVRVRAGSDADAQTDPSVTLTHTVTGGGYQGVTASAVTVMVNETDTKGVIVSPTEMTIPAGGSQAYTVALSSEPTADVTVRVKGATLEVTTDRSRLTFTDDNWRQTQSVTVSVDENFKVTDEGLKVELSHEVSGGDYYDVDAPSVTVTVPVTGTPSAPTGLAVVAGDQSATLTWGAPADDGGSPIQSYQYRYQAAGGTYTSWRTAQGGANATTAEITGLSNGTTYNFEVQAVNATGPGRVATVSTDLPDGPPGAPRGLTATAGNGSITLSWNAPADGGSGILRYDYRYASADGNGSYGEWMEVEGGASTTSVTISGLTNGVGHAFQVRAVNAIGEGEPATRNETPGAVPGAVALATRGGNGTVTLMWDAPADDGGAPILSYDVRYRESGAGWGAWMEVDGGANARSTTIMDLTNGTTYEFQVRAVNGKGDGATATIESTPMPGLDFAHFANGENGGVTITSDIVLVNVETSTVYPAVFFYNQMGEQLDAEMVVDISADLMVTEDGGVSPAMGLEGRGEITISTHGRGSLVLGSAKVFSDGRVGGMLRFVIPDFAVAGVGASEPVNDAIFPARWIVGGINTGLAIRNLSPESMTVTCHLMQGGEVLAMKPVVLAGDGQQSRFIDEEDLFRDWFISSRTSAFVGSVRCMAPEGEMFTGVALEMDFSGGRIFTTLPVVPVDAAAADDGMSMLNFAHFANGDFGGFPTSSDLVFVNVANTAVAPAIYFYDRDGNMIDADTVVDAMMEGIDFADDGALTVMDEIPRLGEMTISTTGMGDDVVGSVRVVSDGPIGGVLRFVTSNIGVAGVGASEAVNAAIFPARYMEGGINTGAAIRNLESEKMTVACKLMQGGRMVDEEDIPLAANAQNSQFITEVFDEIMDSGMSEFVGSVHCSAPEGMMFTGVALEMDFINRVFTTLPVVPVQ